MSGSDAAGAAARRARTVAALHARAAPELLEELCAAAGLTEEPARARVRLEWEALSAYACVRALVATFGFGPDGAGTVDAFHDAVFGDQADGGARRARFAARYDAYGAAARGAGTDDDAAIAGRLGAIAAARMADGGDPSLAELAGALHHALYEAAREAAGEEG